MTFTLWKWLADQQQRIQVRNNLKTKPMIHATFPGLAALEKVWARYVVYLYAYRGPEKTRQNSECDWSLSPCLQTIGEAKYQFHWVWLRFAACWSTLTCCASMPVVLFNSWILQQCTSGNHFSCSRFEAGWYPLGRFRLIAAWIIQRLQHHFPWSFRIESFLHGM